jgi:hypothetical protein
MSVMILVSPKLAAGFAAGGFSGAPAAAGGTTPGTGTPGGATGAGVWPNAEARPRRRKAMERVTDMEKSGNFRVEN